MGGDALVGLRVLFSGAAGRKQAQLRRNEAPGLSLSVIHLPGGPKHRARPLGKGSWHSGVPSRSPVDSLTETPPPSRSS